MVGHWQIYLQACRTTKTATLHASGIAGPQLSVAEAASTFFAATNIHRLGRPEIVEFGRIRWRMRSIQPSLVW